MFDGIRRNTDSGIRHLHGKKLVVRIYGHFDPPMLLIIFDGILYEGAG